MSNKIVVDAMVGFDEDGFYDIQTYGDNGMYETDGYAHDELSKNLFTDNEISKAKVTIEFLEETT